MCWARHAVCHALLCQIPYLLALWPTRATFRDDKLILAEVFSCIVAIRHGAAVALSPSARGTSAIIRQVVSSFFRIHSARHLPAEPRHSEIFKSAGVICSNSHNGTCCAAVCGQGAGAFIVCEYVRDCGHTQPVRLEGALSWQQNPKSAASVRCTDHRCQDAHVSRQSLPGCRWTLRKRSSPEPSRCLNHPGMPQANRHSVSVVLQTSAAAAVRAADRAMRCCRS